MRTALALVFACFVAGCASGPSYLDLLNPLIGRPEAEAITALGVPDRVYTSDSGDGRKYLGWTTHSTRVVPGPYWPGGGFGPYPWRRGGFGYWGPDQYIPTQCAITASVLHGRIEGFTLHGDCPR